MDDCAISVASEFVKPVIDWLKEQAAVIIFYEEKVKELRDGVRKLSYKNESVGHSLHSATYGVERVEVEVSDWIERVKEAEKEARRLLSKNDNTTTTCLRFFPNPITRFKLGRQMASSMKAIDCLRIEINGVQRYTFMGAPPGKPMGVTAQRPDDIVTFGSKASTMISKIMEALIDDKIDVIGVYGMGGVGKTTLMKEIKRQALQKEELFNFVAMATVSENPDLKKIQAVIAEQVGLKFNVNTEEVRAIELHASLKKNHLEKAAPGPSDQLGQNSNKELEDTRAEELIMRLKKNDRGKKVTLVILDDLWKGLDLEKIGIPRNRGVKLLLTSRNQYVLSNEMCSKKNFRVEALDDKESFKLLKKIVGERVNDSPLNSVAIEVANKCSGLPILIKSLAMTLKNKDVNAWNDALEQLKISKDLYSNLELSYKNLEEEKAKSLFLLCSLIGGESIPIRDLHRYSAGLGLFEDINTLEKAWDRVDSLIEILQTCSLLLDSEKGDDSVKINDIVRQIATLIASKEHHALVVDNVGGLYEVERLKKSTAMSLPNVDIEELPEELECPELTILLLYAKDHFLKVADTFFNGMRKLKVLDLTNLCFNSLPTSIQSLQNLRTLCLDYSCIVDLKIIGKLKNLQILSFIESKITCLPREIGELTKLRLLDLTRCSDLVTIEPNVLGSLTRLEELYMEGSFNKWQAEGEAEQTNARLSELNNMSHLDIIVIHIPDATLLPETLPFRKLVKYRILVGEWDWSREYEESRALKLKVNSRNLLFEEWIQAVMQLTQDLYLDGLEGLSRSVYELCLAGFQELKHLHVQNSSAIQSIVRSTKWLPCHAFPSLESLYLVNLINLENICHGLLTEISFSKLKRVKVESCHNLGSLFQISLVRRLLQLEEIEVSKCSKMQAIIANAEPNNDKKAKDEKVVMCNLRRLTLLSLPMASSFIATEKELLSVHPRTSEIARESEDESDSPIAFFNSQKVSLPNLESLTLSGISNLREIWHNQAPFELSALKSLQVESCRSIRHVIGSSLLIKLQNLESLTIEDLQSLEEVFNLEKLNQRENSKLLPKLSVLKLIKLPNLKRILNKNPHNVSAFQSLKWLRLVSCNSLKYLFSSSTAKSLVHLQRMHVINCKSLERIIVKEKNVQRKEVLDTIVLGSLTFLLLEDLPSLLSFSNGNQYINYPALQKLKISNCHEMETFSSDTLMPSDAPFMSFFNEKVLLPELEELTLISMTSLKMIWTSNLSENSFSKLVVVTIKMCDNLLAVFPSYLIKRLQHLERVVISNCDHLGVLFGPVVLAESMEQGNPQNKRELLRLYKLKEVKLDQLQNLTHIVKSDFLKVVGFPSLKNMYLKKCPNLSRVFPNATARTLLKLEKLEIVNCHGLKEVVATEDGQMIDMEPMIFPYLYSMELRNLKSLISFSTGDCLFDFPSLKNLSIMWCHQVKAFILQPTSISESTYSDAKSCSQAFFTSKVEFPSLKELKVAGIKVKELWQDNLSRECFCKLRVLIVERCVQLLNVIPSFMFKRLESLDSLTVKSCISLKCVYDLEGVSIREGEPALSIQLTELFLNQLPDLIEIWNGGTEEYLSFKKLSSIYISNCRNLKYLFPAYVARDLLQLRSLTVEICGLEEIIAEGPEVASSSKFVFPQLKKLTLWRLSKLKRFYTRVHATEWPILEKMVIYGLDNVEIFASNLSSFSEEGAPIQWPLFFVDKDTFPSLVTLRLVWNDIMKQIWDGHFESHLFPQLKNLELKCFHDESANFQSEFILNIQRLEKLVVRKSSFKEMFNLGAHCTEKELVRTPSVVHDSAISSLPELMDTWMGESEPCSIWSNLQILEVSKCNRLEVLMSTSIARSLVQLSRLSISECDSLTEVLATSDSDGTNEIVFHCLTYLKLNSLMNITCFCSGSDNVLKLPSLETVIVGQCPSLRTFSEGACSTPKLEKLWIKEQDDEEEDEDKEDEDEEDEEDDDDDDDDEDEDEDREEKDRKEDGEEDEGEEKGCKWLSVETINTTVRQLFIEMNSLVLEKGTPAGCVHEDV